MKEITIKDCEKLQFEFEKYCETAEQHQFTLLFMVGTRLNQTIEKITLSGKIENQQDIRSMFRVVLKVMGKDFSKYID